MTGVDSGQDTDGPRLDARATTRRATWSVLDQAVSSLTNFALAVVALRYLPLRGFGSFTITYFVSMLVLNVARGLVSEPLLIRFSNVERARWRSAVAGGTAAAVGLGIAAGAVLAAVALLLGGAIREGMLALSVCLPGLLLQDTWRYAFFAAGRPRQAVVNDVAWAVLLAGALVSLVVAGNVTITTVILAWGLSATAAAVLGGFQAGVRPQAHSGPGWLRHNRDLGIPVTGDLLLERGALHASMAAVGAVAGLARVGALNGARVVLGPSNLLSLSVNAVAVPEGVRLADRDPDKLGRAMIGLGMVLASTAVAVGLVALANPFGLVERVIGQSWPAVADVLPALTVYVAAQGVTAGARAGLRVLGAGPQSLIARAVAAPVLMAGAIGGAAWWGAAGAAAGLAVAECFGAAVWWRQFITEHSRARARTRASAAGRHAHDEPLVRRPSSERTT